MIGRLRKELARQQAASLEFDRLVARLGESTKDLTVDGNRGCPDVDLQGWAARRGLEHRGNAPQAGYLSVTCPWSRDLLFNVVRGRLPGGEYGVLCHENRLQYHDESGRFFGGKILRRPPTVGGVLGGAASTVLDIAGVGLPVGSVGTMTVPYTAAGVRVPHLGSITGLHVARRAERSDSLVGTWSTRPLDDLGLPDWVAATRKHTDDAVAERLIAGPIADLLRSDPGLGFELMIQFGQVRVAHQTYLKRDDALDELASIASWTAGVVRDACRPAHAAVALDRRLEPPAWLSAVRTRMHEANTLWPIGARLERVVEIADERGLLIEDARVFHQTHPSLNIPGEAFAVLHGQLPGTSLNGRLLCCAERPMVLPDEFAQVLSDPGGRAGCDVAAIAVRSDATETRPEGELDDDLRVAVAGGVLTAWRTRQSWQANGPALDALAVDVAIAMARRGLLG